ncbi:MAG TPA: GNAT family N-acetyltransferase [Rhodanobacteraceae bacterium]|nr:GNAT family N-acetyltransferase [Rhodanobacteraceae bacterium]
MGAGIDIVDNAAASRYEAKVDGQLCVLDYRRSDGLMVIDHVGVPSAVGGRGIAAALSRTALEDARKHGWRVRVHCSYVAAWLRRHPEFADLTEPG